VKKLVTILVLAILCANLYAQRKAIKREIARDELVYKNEFSIGFRFMTNGWNVFGERNKIMSIYKTRVLQFEFMEFRDLKQTKQQPVDYYNISSFLDSNKDYFFGKQNNFYAFHVGYGYRKRIAGKADKNGVKVMLTYLGGVSLGILKPYYLEYIDSTYVEENTTTYIIVNDRYREENKEKFLNHALITSASGFSHGLIEIEPVPGVYGKLGLNFDWATHDQFVKALELGISLDIYYKRIPIMVQEKNRNYFIGLYLGFQFGKRW